MYALVRVLRAIVGLVVTGTLIFLIDVMRLGSIWHNQKVKTVSCAAPTDRLSPVSQEKRDGHCDDFEVRDAVVYAAKPSAPGTLKACSSRIACSSRSSPVAGPRQSRPSCAKMSSRRRSMSGSRTISILGSTC